MAGQITHMLAGAAALEEALGAGVEAGPAFYLGCQGPDIFYHNQRTKPSGLHYGALAHRRRFGSLVAGAAASLETGDRRPDRVGGAYLLGLATHAAIDRATHPFIIYFAGWVDPSLPSSRDYRGCHPFLERLLDACLLRKRLGIEARDFGLSEKLGLGGTNRAGRQAGDEAILSLVAAGLRAAYPRATAGDSSLRERITNALADARHFYSITDPAATVPGAGGDDRLARLGPEEWKRLASLVYPEKMPAGMDPMNEAGIEWSHPVGDGRVSRASYPQLVDEGSAKAARVIGLVAAYWAGALDEAELAEGLGEGGLALCDRSGLAAPPLLSRPLALLAAMEAEYAARVDVSSPGRYDAQHEHEG
jgi:hypothetical protein